jgi:hemerythrin-like metal-binding protein
LAIEWDDARFSTGIEELDQQHRELFQLFNLLDDAIKSKNEKTVLADIIEGLIEYTEMHFSCEEDYMERLNCSVATENKANHEKFLEQLIDLKNRLERLGPSSFLSAKMHKNLNRWLIDHIENCDAKLREVAPKAP